jgi:hypothetical protein
LTGLLRLGLVFSQTAGFRHSSIADGIAMIEALGATNNFTVVATELFTRNRGDGT